MMAAESPRTARPGPGGFLPPQTSLPSPTPSTASSRAAALLPHPRSKPLVPGSRKEDYARDYVARRLMHVSRRYVKKFGIPDPEDEVTGYGGMEEVCRDLDEVVDVLWFSGTPSLQVPYLLNVALAFNTYLPSFPPAPRPTFAFLRKLDHCFASLLVGFDVKTKDPLPGFTSAVDSSSHKSRFSRTDMVRCKSLADETRMLVAMVMSGEVDVVDYTEDEVLPKRPARARTEDRHDPVETPDPALFEFQEVEEVKTEEEDDDNSAFSSVDEEDEGEEATTPPKRKAEGTIEDVTMADEVVPPKRIKTEDEADTGVNFDGIAPASTISNPPAAKTPKGDQKGKFHWALEEDDDDDDDETDRGQANRPTSIGKPFGVPAVGHVPPSPPHPDSDTEMEDGHGMDGNEANEGDERPEEYEEEGDEDEDEDEEMQMNVGQVYEKTLVQLGQSLGESIIDD
ncbi:hypothetical protein F4802DRAFT_516401 [Xylaria palmicola]|nr:hypothetical protein F4802DRAFT_516401 [Xylaria palmicola]